MKTRYGLSVKLIPNINYFKITSRRKKKLISTVDLEYIKNILLKRYFKTHGGKGNRRLIVSQNIDSVGDDVTFFILQGSPPKGYALHIKGYSKLVFYEAGGKQFKSEIVQEIEGVEK